MADRVKTGRVAGTMCQLKHYNEFGKNVHKMLIGGVFSAKSQIYYPP